MCVPGVAAPGTFSLTEELKQSELNMQKYQKVGKWTLDRQVGNRWLCVCDCGSTRLVLADNLKKRRTYSCGCAKTAVHREVMHKAFGEAQHGLR